MRPIWFKLDKVYCERFKNPTKSSVNLNSNFDLGDFSKSDDFERKNPVFEFKFTYNLKFEDIAEIFFKGSVFIEIDDKSVLKELENKSVNNDVRKLILDYVLIKTHVDSLNFEEKFNLPFHIAPPRVTLSNKDS